MRNMGDESSSDAENSDDNASTDTEFSDKKAEHREALSAKKTQERKPVENSAKRVEKSGKKPDSGDSSDSREGRSADGQSIPDGVIPDSRTADTDGNGDSSSDDD